jgi:NAD(P)H dehydrogenase (quinone)
MKFIYKEYIMNYAVTGSTGSLGSLVIRHMLTSGIQPASIIALARDKSKANDLLKSKVEVRMADYNDRNSLDKALIGVDRLLLISSNDLTKRFDQHKSVIDSAKAAGVKLVVYTSIINADKTSNPLAPDHKATEEYIKKSGMPYVILRNNWYTENFAGDLKGAKDTGVIYSATVSGRIASASRTDYAEAAARVLTGSGHERKIYELSGGTAWNLDEFSAVAGKVLGRNVELKKLSPDARKAGLKAFGIPDNVVEFILSLELSADAGTLSMVTEDLFGLLGRHPLDLKEGLKAIIDSGI